MSETSQLGLPLVQPSQAQKHVTVNEAFARLDGLVQLTLASAATTTPPTAALDGTAYAVPPGAVNAWGGQDGKIAIWSNGGWAFATPKAGWRAQVEDEGKTAIHDGVSWIRSAVALSANRAASIYDVIEFDHVFGSEAVSITSVTIPQYAMVSAITGRVKTAITGSLTSFDVGVAGAANRYGSGIGLAQGSWLVGVTGQPVTYYGPEALVLTANGGSFAGGELRLAIHYFLATPPSI